MQKYVAPKHERGRNLSEDWMVHWHFTLIHAVLIGTWIGLEEAALWVDSIANLKMYYISSPLYVSLLVLATHQVWGTVQLFQDESIRRRTGAMQLVRAVLTIVAFCARFWRDYDQPDWIRPVGSSDTQSVLQNVFIGAIYLQFFVFTSPRFPRGLQPRPKMIVSNDVEPTKIRTDQERLRLMAEN